MEDARFHGRQPEEPVVEHLLEDFRVAEEPGRRVGIAIERRGVGIRLERPTRSGRGGWAGSNVSWRRVKTLSRIAV